MAFVLKAVFLLLMMLLKLTYCFESSLQFSGQSAAITGDPSQGSGIVYGAEGTKVVLLWRYYVPIRDELSEISVAHNERHAVRFFRIRSSAFQVTNITAVYPPFPSDIFINDMENMTVGLQFPAVNRSMAGNYTLSIQYSNIATPAARSTVILYVAAAPVNVRIQLSTRYPLIRSQLEVQCFATGSSSSSLANHGKPLLFRWFHNGMALSHDLVPPPVLVEGQTWVSKLAISAVGEAHAGGYACQAEELGLPTISSTVRITVVGFPTMVQRPFPALAGRPLVLSCQPQLPAGLGVECTSLNVRLTCNGKQLHALSFPTLLPLYDTMRLRTPSRRAENTSNNGELVSPNTNTTTLASVDYTFESVASDLNAADCLCIVKYNRRSLKGDKSLINSNTSIAATVTAPSTTTPSSRLSELLSSIRLVVLYPPDDVKLVADPPFPWLVPSMSDYAKNKSHQDDKPHFRLKCTVGITGNPKNIYFSWPSEKPPPVPRVLTHPNAWSSVLDLTDSLQPSVDNSRLVQCQTNNDAGNGPLAQVRLVVYGSPVVSLMILPSGQLVESSQLVEFREGEKLNVRCLASVFGATPQPQNFIWRRDGLLLSTNSQDLLIPSLNSGHAGRYQCEVVIDTHTSSIGVLTAGLSFRLAVVYINLTVDAIKPSDVIQENDNVTLVCRADGYPMNEIRFDPWLFEPALSAFSPSGEYLPTSRAIPGNFQNKDAKTVEFFENAFREEKRSGDVTLPEMTLHLTNVQPSDSGKYWCSATNQMLLTRRRFISLDVQFKPRLNAALSSSSVMVRIGQPVVLLAAVSANPTPGEFEWSLFNAKTQHLAPIPASWLPERLSPTVCQLHISSLSPTDLADGPLGVAVRVRNSRGQSIFRFTLVARGPPSDPSNFRVLRSSPNSLLLAFEPGFDGGQAQVFQIICSLSEGNQSFVKVVVRDPGYGNTVRVLVQQLQPSTSYKCSVEGVTSGPDNDSALLAASSSWRTVRLFVTSKTVALPLVNFTRVEWILSTPTPPQSPTNSSKFRSSLSKSRREDLYFLNRLCISVGCKSHPQECNSKLLAESDDNENYLSTDVFADTNLAGMKLAAEVVICSQKKKAQKFQNVLKARTVASLTFTTSEPSYSDDCWTAPTNYTVHVWELQQNNASAADENKQLLCLGQSLLSNSSSSGDSDSLSLPRMDSAVTVSVRLFSLMDGDLVATLPHVALNAPPLRKGNSRFFGDGDYSGDGPLEAVIIADGLIWPLIGTVLGIFLVLGFVGVVALIACSAARRASKRGTIRHRMSLSTSSGTDSRAIAGAIYALSSSPSSSTENGVGTSMSKSNNMMTNSIRLSGVGRPGGARDRVSTMTFSSGGCGSLNGDSHRRRSADFQWADFRANPLLSSVGVATTLTPASDYGGASLRCRREERVITCVNGINNAQLFGDGVTYAEVSASLRNTAKQQSGIGDIPEIDAVNIGNPSSFCSPDGSNNDSEFHFEVHHQQQQGRRLSAVSSDVDMDCAKKSANEEGSVVLDDNISPPPRYTTLYSRLADLKPPVDRPVIAPSGCATTPTQYARLDFVKMANLGGCTIAINAAQEPSINSIIARHASRIHNAGRDKPDDISSFH